ncbi:MAG: tRNA adenosine(34) deaminase TadA [Pseudomonadota bacterium]
MREALALAARAARLGEVPVGCVVTHQDRVIAGAHNAPISTNDPSGHAEIRALRLAAKKLNNYRLPECSLYVTLEPCAMCAGAIVHARIKRVVFGAADPRAGAGGSVLNLLAPGYGNHDCEVEGGVLAADCGAQLKAFFRARR